MAEQKRFLSELAEVAPDLALIQELVWRWRKTPTVRLEFFGDNRNNNSRIWTLGVKISGLVGKKP